MNPPRAGTDAVVQGWLALPEPALPYRLVDRLRDAREGRRDGRAQLPRLPEPASDAGGTDVIGTGTGPVCLQTPHLITLDTERAERVRREELAHEVEISQHVRLLAVHSATATVLARALLEAGARLDEAAKPLAPHEADERRSAERDPNTRPNTLVRSRRAAEHDRRLRAAQTECAALQRTFADNLRDAAVLADLVERRAVVTRLRISRIDDHTWRRIAVYWRALIRRHQRGGELNALLAPLRPALPAWARDEADRDSLPEQGDIP